MQNCRVIKSEKDSDPEIWLHVYCLTMYPGCLYYLFHNVTLCSTCHFIPLSPLKGGGPSHFPLTFTSFPKLPPPFHSFPFSSTFPSTLVHSFFFPFPFFFFHLYLFLPSPVPFFSLLSFLLILRIFLRFLPNNKSISVLSSLLPHFHSFLLFLLFFLHSPVHLLIISPPIPF